MSSWRSRTAGRLATAPASFVDPCLPTERGAVPAGPDWLHEIKHDGYRLQIHRRGDLVRLLTRRGADWTARYPRIVAGALALKAEGAILDCEVVCCDGSGLAVYELLHARTNDACAFAYAFDLLELDGEDLRRAPIEDRRRSLRAILPKRAALGIQFNEHLDGDGPTVFAHACKLGLEGIVSKRRGSVYRSGRSETWIKTRNRRAPGYMRFDDVRAS